MSKSLLETIKAICAVQGITIDQKFLESAPTWHIDTWRKAFVPGLQEHNGKSEAVLLKLRMPEGIVSREKFISNESTSAQINKLLARHGLGAQLTLSHNFDQPPEWIVRQFLSGQPIGKLSIDTRVTAPQLFEYLVNLRQALDEILPEIDQKTLGHSNWSAKWQAEFSDRERYVTKHLGAGVASEAQAILAGGGEFHANIGLIHTDLAPPNILQTENGFTIIDWGEGSIGPKSIDWMMVWAFALDLPDLREKILATVFEPSQTDTDLKEARQVALMLATRMLATFAECLDYYQNEGSTEDKSFVEEAESALPKYWAQYQDLKKKLNG